MFSTPNLKTRGSPQLHGHPGCRLIRLQQVLTNYAQYSWITVRVSFKHSYQPSASHVFVSPAFLYTRTVCWCRATAVSTALFSLSAKKGLHQHIVYENTRDYLACENKDFAIFGDTVFKTLCIDKQAKEFHPRASFPVMYAAFLCRKVAQAVLFAPLCAVFIDQALTRFATN